MSGSPSPSTTSTTSTTTPTPITIPTTPLPTLPASWSLASSCQVTDAYYKVSYTDEDGTEWGNNVLAVPTLGGMSVNPSGDCVPPSYTSYQPYLTDGGCPGGYTSNCRAIGFTYSGQSADLVTCCPSVRDSDWTFSCQSTSVDYWLGCIRWGEVGETWTGNFVDYRTDQPKESSTQTTIADEQAPMWALGVIMVSTAPASSTVPPTPAPTNPDPEQPTGDTSTGLSTGAIAGIAVAAVVVGLAALAAAFFIFRKKRKAAAAAAGGMGGNGGNSTSSPSQWGATTAAGTPATVAAAGMYYDPNKPPHMQQQYGGPQEMYQPQPHEMYAQGQHQNQPPQEMYTDNSGATRYQGYYKPPGQDAGGAAEMYADHGVQGQQQQQQQQQWGPPRSELQ